MSLKTEMDVQVTLNITGRDEATGATIDKLNALFAAVKALGGTTTEVHESSEAGSR